jgi:hypothetical protein
MTADITFQRSEYDAALPDWQMTTTLADGESAVKAAGETLLPNPVVATDESPAEVKAIYAKYKQRALYYNAIGRTTVSLIGSVFRKPPTFTVPANLQYMAEDCDGAGVSIYQQSQQALRGSLLTGRGGLLVDYPMTEGAASVADMQSGLIRANIVHYKAEQVVNWQHQRVGGKQILSLVVLKETAQAVSGFETADILQYRELSLIDGIYTVRIWRQDDESEWYVVSESVPRQSNGSAWAEIPFVFIGAVNNDATIDTAPMYDLACVNLKHYQLGADWYNALYFAGQPQPYMTGLDVEWRDWLKDQGIVVGSRAIVPLPVGGAFGYATVPADTAIQKELADLKEQMISLGARLVTPGEAVKTATQSAGEQEASHSVVSLTAENLSDAYTKALEWALAFMGGAGECEYRLSNDLAVIAWDAPMISALIQAWQSGTVPKPDIQKFMQRIGLIDAERTPEELADMESEALDLG